LLLHAAYSNYQTGAFENFHQLIEDTLMVLRPGPKIVFQYKLRFANRLKSQLLIGHLFLPIKQTRPSGKREREIKTLLGNIPDFFNYTINFCFNVEPAGRSTQGVIVFDTAEDEHVVSVEHIGDDGENGENGNGG
jgi:hypothetical protein